MTTGQLRLLRFVFAGILPTEEYSDIASWDPCFKSCIRKTRLSLLTDIPIPRIQLVRRPEVPSVGATETQQKILVQKINKAIDYPEFTPKESITLPQKSFKRTRS